MVLIFALFASFLKRFIRLYNLRTIMYEKAQRYLASDVCQHHRGLLEDFNFCREAEEWSVWPALGVLSDLLEDASLCGHNRCVDVYNSLMYTIPVVILLSTCASIVYCCVTTRRNPMYLPALIN